MARALSASSASYASESSAAYASPSVIRSGSAGIAKPDQQLARAAAGTCGVNGTVGDPPSKDIGVLREEVSVMGKDIQALRGDVTGIRNDSRNHKVPPAQIPSPTVEQS